MKLTVTVSYSVEVELDDRVTPSEIEHARDRVFETSDGRQSMSVEMGERMARETAEDFARIAQQSMGYRIAGKYPGTRQRGYVITERIPTPKLGYHIEQKIKYRR